MWSCANLASSFLEGGNSCTELLKASVNSVLCALEINFSINKNHNEQIIFVGSGITPFDIFFRFEVHNIQFFT